jgi:decaprenylphospho-beta-D-erythro-pentofuranosid-2-ulose 2-reductase
MIDGLDSCQNIVLIGGTSEIGLAIVKELRTAKLQRVVLAGRDVKALEAARDSLSGGQLRIDVESYDAADAVSHADWFAKVAADLGDVDLVVFAVGQLGDQPAMEVDPHKAAALINVNFAGAASTLLAVADVMKRQGYGKVVVLSSVAGERVRAANYIYGSSKAGLDAFTQGLQSKLVGTGVHVMIVRPGFVHTRMTEGMAKAPFATTPDVVAKAVASGLSKNTRVVWAPAPLRAVMAVLRHLPTVVFRRLPG